MFSPQSHVSRWNQHRNVRLMLLKKLPESLKDLCFQLLRDNRTVEHTLKAISTFKSLVLEFAPYLSPYGVFLLEDITTYQVSDHIWLTQWFFVQSYAFKARNRQKIDLYSKFQSFTTNKQFFYNALMTDVVDKLHEGVHVEKCHQEALKCMMQYPDRKKGDAEHTVHIGVRPFIQMLSAHMSMLTLTSTAAHRIMADLDIFLPVVERVAKVNINLMIGCLGELESVGLLILHLRKNKLTSVKIFCSEDQLAMNMDTLEDITRMMYNPLDVLLEESFGKSELDKNEELDLYDYALIPLRSRNTFPSFDRVVETNICELNLLAIGSKLCILLSDALNRWRALTTLIIDNVPLIVTLGDYNTALISLADMGCLKNLSIIDTICYGIEKGIKYIAAPTCTKHQKRCVLQMLSLRNTLIYRDRDFPLESDFLPTILTCPEKCSKHDTSGFHGKCEFQGLKSFAITMFDNRYEIDEYVNDNEYLEELFVYRGYHNDGYTELIEHVAEHPTLKTFSVTSDYRRQNNQRAFVRLLQKEKVEQLQFYRCFSCKVIIPPDMNMKFYTSHLHTFVWSSNDLDDDGLCQFSSILADRRNFPRLKVLDISENKFTRVSIPAFAESFQTSNRYLWKLSFYNDRVAYEQILWNGFLDVFRKHVSIMTGSHANAISVRTDYVSEM